MAYLGKTPSQAVRRSYFYTATGGETSLSGADDNSNVLNFSDGKYVDVYLNGVLLASGDYNTTTANTIGGLAALTANDIVEIIVYDTFSVFSGNVTGDFDVSGTMTANSYSGDGSALTGINTDLVDDTTPQLGGNLDLNSNDITGTGDINITGTVTADGLTVDGDAVFSNGDTSVLNGDDFAKIKFNSSDASNNSSGTLSEIADVATNTYDGSATRHKLVVRTNDDFAATGTNKDRISVDYTGDISFYDSTGTTQGLYWDASTQRLGLGTTSPDRQVDIQGNVPAVRLTDTSVTGLYHEILGDGNSLSIEADDSNVGSGSSINFKVDGSERMRIDSDGNVGIGTTSPDASLHIEGSGVSALRFGNFGQSGNTALRLSRDDTIVYSGNPLGYLEFGGNDSTSNTDAAFAYVSGEASGTHGAGDNPTDLTFGTTADGSSTPAERMRIDSSGNVGIGTSSVDLTSAGRTVVQVEGSNNALVNITDGTSRLYLHQKGGTSGSDIWNSADSYMRFATNDTERMRITNGGNVGIGTTSPSAGLHIDNPDNSAITAILDTDNSAVKMVFRNNTETGNNVQIGADGSALVANTGGSERMRIDSSGNITATSEGGTSNIVDLRQGSAKQWSNVDGIGTVHFDDSYNSSSVTDVSTGRYDIFINNDMNNAHYSLHLSSEIGGGNGGFNGVDDSNNTASKYRHIAFTDSGALRDVDPAFGTIHGDLA